MPYEAFEIGNVSGGRKTKRENQINPCQCEGAPAGEGQARSQARENTTMKASRTIAGEQRKIQSVVQMCKFVPALCESLREILRSLSA
jgi:hypothetical protein